MILSNTLKFVQFPRFKLLVSSLLISYSPCITSMVTQ